MKTLDISGVEISEQLKPLFSAARKLDPEVTFTGTVSVYGADFDVASDIMILNDKKVKSLDNVHLAIELFPGVKTIEMCGCGVSNEKMQALREQYPNIKFVWTVKVLKYTLRTDIQVFSTLASDFSRPGNSKNLYPLFKYCTELRALDLGHMAITDISEMRNLKKLHTLILADNKVNDITPLADLKELEYIEIFFNRLTDVSAFTELPKLEDLNICYNPHLLNPTGFTQCPTLRRLYCSHCGISVQDRITMQQGLPADCEFNWTAANCVYDGWRDNAKNAVIRNVFRTWWKVKEYPAWDAAVY